MNTPRTIAAATLFVVLFAATSAFAQGVGINATGAAADTSALLDLSSNTKGLLVPRMTALERASIFAPATGLLIYQTDAPSGFCYNYGTPGAPIWMQVASPLSGQWQTNGSDIYYSTGKVGIGTLPTAGYGLEVVNTFNGLRVQTNTPGGTALSFGGFGKFVVDAPGIVGGRFTLLENGNLGLGNQSPTNQLSFGTAIGKKISLYPDASGGDYGLGIASGRLKIYAGNTVADVALGYDSLGTFREQFTVKPNGALAVRGNTGTAGQVLQSNGSGAQAAWATPGGGVWSTNGTSAYYNAGNVGIGISTPNAPLGFPPALGRKITLYPGATGDVGFGVAGNRLQIYADNPNADVALGWDAAGTFNERFAVKPTGALAVNGQVGNAGQVLQSNGGAAATWVSSTNAAFNNTYQGVCNTYTIFPNAGAEAAIPGLSQAFSVTSNAKVLVTYTITLYAPTCFACGTSTASIWVLLDGGHVNVEQEVLPNGTRTTASGTLMMTVAPGTHTVAISATNFGPDLQVGSTGLVGSFLTLQVMQQ